MIDSANRHLADTMTWGKWCKAKLTHEIIQTMVMSLSRQDTDLLCGKLRLGRDTTTLQEGVNILGVDARHT